MEIVLQSMETFPINYCTSDFRPSSTKSSTYSDTSDNYDRRHQSVDDDDQFYPSSHVVRSDSFRVSHNHARTDSPLQKEYPGLLSSVFPGSSGYARDTFADQSSRRHEDDVIRRSASPQPMPFDGNGSWRAFFADFSSYVNERDWDDSQMDRYLYRCLDGEARDYFKFVVNREPNIPFWVLVQLLEEHFAENEFVRSEQLFDESCSEWADRVLELATHAYPDRSRRFIYSEAIDKFCDGAYDCKAGQYAADSQPQTLDEALYLVRLYSSEQLFDESCSEWADRVLELATHAYPDRSRRFIYSEAIDKFCDGAYDCKAGQYAADSQPQTLDEALYLVRLYRHKYRTPHGKVKKDAFQHSSEAWPSESKQSAYDSQHGKLKKDVSQHSSEALPSESKWVAYDSPHGKLKKDNQYSSEALPSESTLPTSEPSIKEMSFTYARQCSEESSAEWAVRLLTLAIQAFPGLPEEHLQQQVVLRFCQGSINREAAQFAINSQPKDLDEALYRVCFFHCTHPTPTSDSQHGKLKKNTQHSSDALPSESSLLMSQPFIRQDNLCEQKTKPEVVLQNLDIKVDTLVSNFNVQGTQLNYLETRVDSLSSRVESVQENTDSILHEIDTLKNLVQGVALSVNEIGDDKKYQQLYSCQCTRSDEHKDRPKDSSSDSAFFASDAGSFQEFPFDFPKSNSAISPSLITAKDENPLSFPHVMVNHDGGVVCECLSSSPTVTDDVRVIPPVLASSPALKVGVNLAPPKTSQSSGCEGGRPAPIGVRTDEPLPDECESSRQPLPPTCPWVLPPWPPP